MYKISMLGFGLAFTASALITAKDTVSKKLSSSINSSTSAFASFLFPLPFYMVLLFVLSAIGIPVFATNAGFWKFAVARAIADTGAEWCKMRAFALGELSVVTSFFALYPILLLVSSPLITNDALEPKTPLSIAIIVIGTIVILYRPRGSKQIPWKAIGLALLAAFFFSLNTALDRATVQKAHPVFSAFVMTVFSAIFVSPTLTRTSLGDLNKHKKLFTARGIFEVLFMTIKLFALTLLSAPLVVGIGRLSMVLNVLAGHFFFGEKQVAQRLFGAAIVCGGVVYLIV